MGHAVQPVDEKDVVAGSVTGKYATEVIRAALVVPGCDSTALDLARSSPSRIANQSINEGRCSFLKLLAAVSSALHHGKSSREGYNNTSKSICIDRGQLVGSGANCFADELLKSDEQTLHALAHCCARNSRIERGARCQATPRRRTACHIRNDHVE